MKSLLSFLIFTVCISFSYSQCNNKVLFIVDDSGSVSFSERQDMEASIQQLSNQIFSQNPLAEIGLVQYGQPDASSTSQPSYYLSYPFTVNPTISIPDNPGGNNLIQDVLPNSINTMINDGLFTTGGAFDNTTSIFIFTDALIDSGCSSVLTNCSSCNVPALSCGYDYLTDLSNSLGGIPISTYRVTSSFNPGTADGIQQGAGVLIEGSNFQLNSTQIDLLTDSLICIDADYDVFNTCIGDTTQFTLTTSDPITSALWDFGDGSPTSSDLNPTHTFPALGDYVITLTLTSNGEVVTTTNTITISDIPVANPIPDYILCDDLSNDQTELFDLTTRDVFILGSQSAADFTINYFANFTDADNNQNALSTNYFNTSNNQDIFARIYNTNNPDCYSITDFKLIVDAQPIANPVSDFIVCDDDTNDGIATFDLSNIDNEVLAGQSATTFTVVYYLTNLDAIGDNNPLPNNYTTTSANQIIYAKVFNTSNTDCFAITTVNLIVDVKPIANPVPDFINCENDPSLINLNQFNTTVLGTQNSTDLVVTYHTSEADAIAGQNALSNNYQLDQTTTLYIKVENTNGIGCYDITTVNLSIFEFPFLDAKTIEDCLPNNYNINADIGITNATYLWDSGETTAAINVNSFGIYNVQITIGNCTKNQTITFVKANNCNIPQGISPNDDTLNDFFDISYLEVDNIIIYNRYGTEVYSKANYAKEWNGQSNSGQELPTGTYYYVIKTKTDPKPLTGWVYLAR
ncbi:gliding motility-associated C-terminal domain-containing protein [Olleya sp. UBA1516]|uniref:T9SS type B sorting domain-containing protein n=1 Tax=Olleya sp. UBA1516 TaxID=1947013 RepID=UPI0025DD5ACC|nr:gliding motility-associated C-terminal domain-containing protein [Olleya sp. UBA1516]